ncbi:cytochrome P450 [Bradyrhizobium sp. CIAT3101]|uniref:cytochrome P450 n=1 Tax=Bradyrhizobium sp. CIAT3101 TaxID=439387 RepID=UPI0024B0ACA3|nr:cytochrome P450 [Bradyrhizobium sp. CIAT3101]WFU84912.1 cytochrome P450 [Bradyrhizobium sp. CIAT3101]
MNRSESPADAYDTPLSDIDVSNPAIYQQDIWQPLFARLRREAPVHYCAESRYGPYWSVSSYNDIMAVELDHATYSSQLGAGFQIADIPADMNRRSFIRMDPPRHTAQRKAVAPVAAPKNLASYEISIRERTRAVLDALPRNESFDWVDKVSIELTTMMLATLFDFPWQERRKLTYWSDVAVCDINAPDALVHSEEARSAELMRMADTFKGLWQERAKAPPRLDLISLMAHNAETRDLPAMEFVGNLALLIVGGNDTTRNSMSGGLLALSENPDQLAKLKANPGLVPGLVAETIRYQTPVIHMRRTATRDCELAGQRIRRGDKVIMWYVSGNRDESVIDRPEHFIIDRAKPRQHLSYGAGIHRCVGDRLADLQLRILWEEILARDLDIEVLGPPRRLHSNFIRGIRELPVRING